MIEVLRLGHRISRDKRLTSHVALTSRAFSADKIYYSGQKDGNFENSVNKIVKDFGGKFEVEYVKDALKLVKSKENFKVVHLTVYGLPIQDKIKEIRKFENLFIIVGGEKVPIEFYDLSNYNISVVSQPHSEVAALAIFLDYYFEGKELRRKFKGGKEIIPREKGKKVI